MIVDICISIITASFVLITFFLIKTLRSTNLLLKETKPAVIQTKNEIKELSEEARKLIKNTNTLTSDLKEKSSSVDFIFKPFHEINKPKSNAHQENSKDTCENIVQIAAGITACIALFKKIT